MPATTSTFGRFMQEIDRLDGVPPNMSVSTATPSPVSTRLIASMMSLRRCSTSSSGPMVTDFDLLLGADDVFERGTELNGEPTVGNEDETDHEELLAGAVLVCAARKGAHLDHPKCLGKALPANKSAIIALR